MVGVFTTSVQKSIMTNSKDVRPLVGKCASSAFQLFLPNLWKRDPRDRDLALDFKSYQTHWAKFSQLVRERHVVPGHSWGTQQLRSVISRNPHFTQSPSAGTHSGPRTHRQGLKGLWFQPLPAMSLDCVALSSNSEHLLPRFGRST